MQWWRQGAWAAPRNATGKREEDRNQRGFRAGIHGGLCVSFRRGTWTWLDPHGGPMEKALHGLLHRPQQSVHRLTKSPFTGNSVVTWKNAYPGSFEAGGERGKQVLKLMGSMIII